MFGQVRLGLAMLELPGGAGAGAVLVLCSFVLQYYGLGWDVFGLTWAGCAGFA